MRTSLREMPKNVIDYVVKGTMIVNLVLLLCHLNFGVLFYVYEAPVLFWYNMLSIITYIVAFELLRRQKAWTYVVVVYVEIFVFMILAVVFLGWDFGFQHYCMGFVASMIFTDFYMNSNRSMRKRTKALVVGNVLLYLALRFWTYSHPYIYAIDNSFIVHALYVVNTLIGFSFLIVYFAIYSSTVYKLEQELLEMANLDPLTGLCNRRKMKQILSAIPEEDERMVIAMLDIDFFKNINDKYGHDAGDEVLKMVAEVLNQKNAEKENFQVCRWGGEEFLVFYGNYEGSKEDIVREFEQIRRDVEVREVCYEQQKIHVTVTMGLAFAQNRTSMEALIKEADTKLYEGKENGRNRVEA